MKATLRLISALPLFIFLVIFGTSTTSKKKMKSRQKTLHAQIFQDDTIKVIQDCKKLGHSFAKKIKNQLAYVPNTCAWNTVPKWVTGTVDSVLSTISEITGHGELKPEEINFMQRFTQEENHPKIKEVFETFEHSERRIQLFTEITKEVKPETTFEDLKKIMEGSTKKYIDKPHKIDKKKDGKYVVSWELYNDVISTNVLVCAMHEEGLFKTDNVVDKH